MVGPQIVDPMRSPADNPGGSIEPEGGSALSATTVKISVRRAMGLVAVAALGLWLTVPAVKILRDPARHTLTHLWQRPDGSYLFSGHPVGFWARYRRKLLDLPWDCSLEMCRENAKVGREVDSGKTTDALIRDHPEVIAGR